MKYKKAQTKKIIDGFITTVVILVSATLVASGVAITKANTDYMSTGIKATKIFAERENTEISISLNDQMQPTTKITLPTVVQVVSFLPPPVNTGYMIYCEVKDVLSEK